MKQISAILLLLTIFSVFAYSQKPKKADYSQKIKEATPKSLPQTPAAKKQTSDAQDERLKGKIKSLVEESESLTGVSKPYGRRTSKTSDFDEQGNYLRRVYFDSKGRPYDIAVYGYIDDARASLYNSIKYGDELYATFPGDNKKTQEKPKPDPRFTYKYEYKVTNGKLSEMQMIRNIGEKGMRYVYNYDGNQREYLAYTDEDELNQRYIYTFDDKGNDIESTNFSVRQETIYGKYRYTYETFDKQGNWTKRTYLKLEIENGKEVYKPLAIEYRTTTYYP